MLSDQDLMNVQAVAERISSPVTLYVNEGTPGDPFGTNLSYIARQMSGVSVNRIQIEFDPEVPPFPDKPSLTLAARLRETFITLLLRRPRVVAFSGGASLAWRDGTPGYGRHSASGRPQISCRLAYPGRSRLPTLPPGSSLGAFSCDSPAIDQVDRGGCSAVRGHSVAVQN